MIGLCQSWILVVCATFLCVSVGDAFVVPSPTFSLRTSTCLEAKKKKKKATAGQGFSKAPPPPPPAPKAPEPEPVGPESGQEEEASTFLQSIETGGSASIPTLDDDAPPEERAKALLRDKYGLRTREEQEQENKRQKARQDAQKRTAELKKLEELDKDVDIMAMLPPPVLIAIDRFLKIGVAVCTVAFVAAGLAITAEAWANSSGNPLPPDVDEFITNVVEPNFTPGLVVLLGFSVSLGVFAAAQLGSDSSQYREDN